MSALRVTLVLAAALVASSVASEIHPRLQPYLAVLTQHGRPPLQFVIDKLDEVDLIVFDDAWHPAAEPFEFYEELVRAPEFRKRARYVFLEVVSINKQHHIDAYMQSQPEDRTLLHPAFQDDFSGTGWPLKSYFDLLHAIYSVNRGLDEDKRIQVVAVNHASYWSEIRTALDVRLFRKTLSGNDYTMYRTIVDELDGFSGARKGVFLTNTRHAYKGIKDRQGRYFWNAGTFLHQRHPGKTYSIRFHNMALSIEGQKTSDKNEPETTAGMEKYTYSWIRMADGLWDSAFEAFGNTPIAFPLDGNVFGAERYVGNHMHRAAPDQTMSDANDAIIFLQPLEELHNTAMVDFIYTSQFKQELARRYRILYTAEQLQARYQRSGVDSLEDLIEGECAARPRQLIPQAATLKPRDTWKQ